jgi:hypothetical protein
MPWYNARWCGVVLCRCSRTARSCIKNYMGSCGNTRPRVVNSGADPGPRDQAKHPYWMWKRYSRHAQLVSRVHWHYREAELRRPLEVCDPAY